VPTHLAHPTRGRATDVTSGPECPDPDPIPTSVGRHRQWCSPVRAERTREEPRTPVPRHMCPPAGQADSQLVELVEPAHRAGNIDACGHGRVGGDCSAPVRRDAKASASRDGRPRSSIRPGFTASASVSRLAGDTSCVTLPEWGVAHSLTSADTLAEHYGPKARCAPATEDQVGLFNSRNRGRVAIAIRADGRRVLVPADDLGLVDVSLLGLLRSIELGIERVFVLITGSRRETGRRDKR
jgi:hypothetical protein